MKESILFIFGVLVISVSTAFGQVQSGEIEIRKGLETKFFLDGDRLTPRELQELTEGNQEAYEEMRIAKANHAVGSVFGAAGGFLVGWPLGTAIGGGDPNWALAGIGAGLIVVSIPFSSAYNRHATNAANMYNDEARGEAEGKMDLDLKIAGNQIGIRINF